MPAGRGLHNPLGLAQIIVRLENALQNQGLEIRCSSDMRTFADAKIQARGEAPAPMHDATVCDFTSERAFWMGLQSANGAWLGLQAFRCDQVHTSLADWCANYMIGVYMRRGELMVPSHSHPPHGSIAERLNGTLVYHGELWVDPQVKTQNAVDLFTRLGSYLALAKWNPDAIWALTKQRLATRGMMGRFNFSTVERGFLRWKVASEGIDSVEYLAVAERQYLQQAIEEDLSSGPFAEFEETEALQPAAAARTAVRSL